MGITHRYFADHKILCALWSGEIADDEALGAPVAAMATIGEAMGVTLLADLRTARLSAQSPDLVAMFFEMHRAADLGGVIERVVILCSDEMFEQARGLRQLALDEGLPISVLTTLSFAGVSLNQPADLLEGMLDTMRTEA